MSSMRRSAAARLAALGVTARASVRRRNTVLARWSRRGAARSSRRCKFCRASSICTARWISGGTRPDPSGGIDCSVMRGALSLPFVGHIPLSGQPPCRVRQVGETSGLFAMHHQYGMFWRAEQGGKACTKRHRDPIKKNVRFLSVQAPVSMVRSESASRAAFAPTNLPSPARWLPFRGDAAEMANKGLRLPTLAASSH